MAYDPSCAAVQRWQFFSVFMRSQKIIAMKRCILILFFAVFFLLVGATVHGQTVSLDAKNESLVNVLRSIQSQSGYSIIWVDKQMQMAKKVNVTLKNVSVQEALEKVFSDQPLRYVIEADEKRVIIQVRKKNDAAEEDPGSRKLDVVGE